MVTTPQLWSPEPLGSQARGPWSHQGGQCVTRTGPSPQPLLVSCLAFWEPRSLEARRGEPRAAGTGGHQEAKQSPASPREHSIRTGGGWAGPWAEPSPAHPAARWPSCGRWPAGGGWASAGALPACLPTPTLTLGPPWGVPVMGCDGCSSRSWGVSWTLPVPMSALNGLSSSTRLPPRGWGTGPSPEDRGGGGLALRG